MTRPGPKYPLFAVMAAVLFMATLSSTIVNPASAQAGASVKVQNYAFTPASITVVIGINNTVTWTNMDSVTHTVTANDGSFNSGDLAPGQTFTHTFTAPGSFGYHCSIHTFMKGTVVVEASGTTTTSASSTTYSTTSFTSSFTSSSATSFTHSSTATSTTSTATTPAPVSTSSTTSPSTTSTGSASGGVPEFPFQGALLTVLTLAMVVSYFVFRRSVRGRSPKGPTLA